MKKLIINGSLVALVMAGAVLGLRAANNCCGMTGTTICGEGTTWYFIICSVFPPSTAICTGSSEGVPLPDAEYASAMGTDNMRLSAGTCSVTVTATGACCGGAITEWGAIEDYYYGACTGNPCPRG